MVKKIVWKWEQLDETTVRAKVIGGWIVNQIFGTGSKIQNSTVFVPDREHEWQVIPPYDHELEADKKRTDADNFKPRT